MTPAMNTPRFAVDTMLGRLARWLRLLGYDTLYDRQLSGRALMRRARTEGRTVLTRDRKLDGDLQCPVCFVESDHVREQVQQVVHTFALTRFDGLLTRCVCCNCAVVPVAKQDIAHLVPAYVLATHARFARCPRCGRAFWRGTHVARVRAELAAMGFGQAPDDTT